MQEWKDEALTEELWLTCNQPVGMLKFIDDEVSVRKAQLFAVACLRRIWHLLPGPRSREAVEIRERYADGEATEGAFDNARDLAREEGVLFQPNHPSRFAGQAVSDEYLAGIVLDASDAIGWEKKATDRPVTEWEPELVAQCGLVREIFGNPFRLVSLNQSWLTPTVKQLAQSMYDDRAFDRLPILADTLEDAGCDSADILNHCRQPGEHVRGCWIVDKILGNE